MPLRILALAELSHKDFDEHYLRRFAHFMPMFTRPPLDRTPYSLDQFMDHFADRLGEGLRRSGHGALARELAERPFLETHIAFKALEECIFAHLDAGDVTQSVGFIREELRRIVLEKDLLLEDERHPLHGHYKVKFVKKAHESIFWEKGHHDANANDHDAMSRVMEVGKDDQHIAGSLADVDLADLLRRYAPEYVSRHPECRILQFCVRFRGKMRKALSNGVLLDGGLRDSFLLQIIEEWTIVRSSQIGKTANEEKNMHRLDVHIDELQKQLEIKDIEHDPPAETIQTIIAGMEQNGGAFMQYLPLLENLLLDLAHQANDGGVRDLFQTILRIFQRNSLSVCDYPGMQIAMLAVCARFSTKEHLLQMVN